MRLVHRARGRGARLVCGRSLLFHRMQLLHREVESVQWVSAGTRHSELCTYANMGAILTCAQHVALLPKP